MNAAPHRLDVPGITTSSSPYPSAVVVGDLVFVSGQVSFDDSGSVVAEGDVTGQTRQVLERLQRVLLMSGATLDGVVSTTVYLSRASYAGAFNTEWSRWFGSRRPARATVVAQLLDERLLVEVQAIAVRTSPDTEGGTSPSRAGAE